MRLVNERTTSWITARFRDRNRQLAMPSAVTYRIDCLTTGTQIRGWTSIAPAAEVEIAVSAEENAILGGHEREKRCVTVVATYGEGNDDQVTDRVKFEVLNQEFVE